MGKCILCGGSNKEKGFSDLLSNEELKRFNLIERKKSICIDCKTDLLYANILSPYK